MHRSHLVYLINIQNSKQRARICPVPKMIEPESPANYRLIKVVLFQMTNFIENKHLHHEYELMGLQALVLSFWVGLLALSR